MEMREERIKQGNKILFIFTIIGILFCCSTKENRNTTQFQKQEFSSCDDYDSTINHKLILNDASSFRKYMGHKKRRAYDDWFYFSSKDKHQYIALQTNFGGGVDEYKKFEVGYITGDYDKFIPSRVIKHFEINSKPSPLFLFENIQLDNFTTESGIRLGMLEKEFNELMKGKKLDSRFNGNTLIYKYLNEDCLYEADYQFKNDSLILFTFGYITP